MFGSYQNISPLLLTLQYSIKIAKWLSLKMMKRVLTLFAPCRVFAYICLQSVLKKLDIPNYEFGKGQCAFYPIQLSCFAGKIKFIRNNRIFHKEGPLQTVPTNQKFQNSNIILEESRLPNFMKPFEYGKLFHEKSFPEELEPQPHQTPRYLVLPPRPPCRLREGCK